MLSGMELDRGANLITKIAQSIGSQSGRTCGMIAGRTDVINGHRSVILEAKRSTGIAIGWESMRYVVCPIIYIMLNRDRNVELTA